MIINVPIQEGHMTKVYIKSREIDVSCYFRFVHPSVSEYYIFTIIVYLQQCLTVANFVCQYASISCVLSVGCVIYIRITRNTPCTPLEIKSTQDLLNLVKAQKMCDCKKLDMISEIYSVTSSILSAIYDSYCKLF